MLLKAILVALWAGICSLDDQGAQTAIRKPLLASAVTGLILGDFKQGLIIGATLELMWLGVNAVGAYLPPDMIAGSIIGTTIGITSGGGAATGIAFAVPVSLLVMQLVILVQTYLITHLHKADSLAHTGDFDKIDKWHLAGGIPFFLIRFIPTFLAVYLGNDFISKIINFIPESIMTGLEVASSILPAVGIAMLLTVMLKKNMWMYLLFGFVLASYFEIPLFAISLIGLGVAGTLDILTKDKTSNNNDKEEVYDL